MKNGKKRPAGAAKTWWRVAQKIRRKTPDISPNEIAKAKAEFDRKLDRKNADLLAQAAENKRLKAEHERLAREALRIKADWAEIAACIDVGLCKKCPEKAMRHALELMRAAGKLADTTRMQAGLAKIAAQINPELCKSNPDEAVKIAVRLVKTGEELAVSEEKAARRAEANKNLAGIHLSFKRGVRFMTDERNFDRAEPKFKSFLAATFIKDGEADIRLQHFKSKGFTGNQWATLYRPFKTWWKQEKSNRAKKSALARKKQKGRVKRPKSDLRFAENRRHRKGYCQKCGARVRKRERLCDTCLSGKPLLLTAEAPLSDHGAGPNFPIDLTYVAGAKGSLSGTRWDARDKYEMPEIYKKHGIQIPGLRGKKN